MHAARAECANWERFFVSTVREQVLSEFIDAWNAGRRPEVDDYIARVPAEDLIQVGRPLVRPVEADGQPQPDDGDDPDEAEPDAHPAQAFQHGGG